MLGFFVSDIPWISIGRSNMKVCRDTATACEMKPEPQVFQSRGNGNDQQNETLFTSPASLPV